MVFCSREDYDSLPLKIVRIEVIKMEIDIKKIRVHITDSTDRVTIYTHMPSPFPPEVTKADLEIEFHVAKGAGVDYVREHFGVDPEVIDTSMRK